MNWRPAEGLFAKLRFRFHSVASSYENAVARFAVSRDSVDIVMAFYAFVLEPPAPRAEFVEKEPTTSVETEDVRARAFEQAMVNVLIRFPEAYRAVLEEMRRLEVEEKKSP